MSGIPDHRLTPLFLSLAILVLILGGFFLIHEPSGAPGEEITGKVASRLFVVARYPLWCNTTVYQGYNLFALHCIPTNASVAHVFEGFLGNMTSLHTYVDGDAADHWKAYNPDLPAWVVQDLVTIERTQGYWLRMDSDTPLRINGTYSLPAMNAFGPGWNLAGYALKIEKNVTDALNGIQSGLTLILGYNATDPGDPWKSYDPDVVPAFNDLDLFHPFHGYWINMTGNASWYLDE